MSNVLTHTTSAPVTGGTERNQPVQVRSHLAAAVAVALLCFAPTGVAAVVYAGNVRTRLALGDVEGARKASAMARRLVWASVAMTVTFLLVVVVGANGYSDTH
jgi:Interferon-induced transmembrane protein